MVGRLWRVLMGALSFVEGAIPGETVEADITHRRKDFWRAQATSVVAGAPTRVDPPCPYFKAGCGGCQLQYLAYPEQLAQKRQVLQRQLERAHLEFPLDRIDVLAMDDPWRYRIRGEFHVLRRAGAVSLGFYRKHTYQTLPIDACLIHAEVIERALPAFARAARTRQPVASRRCSSPGRRGRATCCGRRTLRVRRIPDLGRAPRAGSRSQPQ